MPTRTCGAFFHAIKCQGPERGERLFHGRRIINSPSLCRQEVSTNWHNFVFSPVCNSLARVPHRATLCSRGAPLIKLMRPVAYQMRVLYVCRPEVFARVRLLCVNNLLRTSYYAKRGRRMNFTVGDSQKLN
jgi:hypothetical protein